MLAQSCELPEATLARSGVEVGRASFWVENKSRQISQRRIKSILNLSLVQSEIGVEVTCQTERCCPLANKVISFFSLAFASQNSHFLYHSRASSHSIESLINPASTSYTLPAHSLPSTSSPYLSHLFVAPIYRPIPTPIYQPPGSHATCLT